jgi:hypothetical protein
VRFFKFYFFRLGFLDHPLERGVGTSAADVGRRGKRMEDVAEGGHPDEENAHRVVQAGFFLPLEFPACEVLQL